MVDITWECFAYVNAPNKPAKFEDMCRLLFKQQYVSDTQVVHTNPNNPGVESDPITRISDGKRICYQAKYFENTIGYSQIRDSMEKAVTYYAGQVDIIFLYCNKSINTTTGSYVKTVDFLNQNSIELIPVCNDEILDTLKTQQHKDIIKNILKEYFTCKQAV